MTEGTSSNNSKWGDKSRYSDKTRYGDKSRYGDKTRYDTAADASSSPERGIKNMPPASGVAFWPPTTE